MEIDLKALQQEAKLNGKETAELTGHSVQSVSNWAVGRQRPHASVAACLVMWAELDDAARGRVRQRLAELRRPCAAETA